MSSQSMITKTYNMYRVRMNKQSIGEHFQGQPHPNSREKALRIPKQIILIRVNMSRKAARKKKAYLIQRA